MQKNCFRAMMSAVMLAAMLATTALATSPVDVQRRNVNGDELITKTYELPPGSDPAVLAEEDFEQDGFLFAHLTTVSEEISAVDTKVVQEAQTAETSGKTLDEVLRKFPTTIPYEQDGYTGMLVLDTGSISTEAAGYTTSSRTISATQTYPGMMYQDPSAIPQATVKDGVTLPLTGVSWTVTGTSLAGDSLVPTEFTATATYSKKVSSSVPTGYISTATYSGEVSKTNVDSVVYTVTYLGTPLPEDTESGTFPWGVLLRLLALLLAIGGVVFVVLFIRSRQGVQVYNLIENDYLCIGRQQLDRERPAIDLNEFGDMVQSKFFSFVLDKATTRRLFGRTISVTLGDITMTHQVRELKGPYRFNLEVGVDL